MLIVPNAVEGDGSKDAEIPCEATAGAFSPEVEVPMSGGTIRFVSVADRKPVAIAKIPPNMRKVILMFIGSGKGATGLPWKVFVIEDSLKVIPDSGAFVANLMKSDVLVTFGESKWVIKSGSVHSSDAPKELTNFNMAPVVFQIKEGEGLLNVSRTMMPFNEGIRYLFFAYTDSNGRPRMTPYQDSTPEKSAQAKTP